MNKSKKIHQAVDFQQYLADKLKDAKFRKHYQTYDQQLKVAYQILKMRKKRKLSQAALAKKLGTRQSDIARMESGQQNFTTAMLEKICHALGCRLKIELVK
jgi:ribosome-binding protein aMBF1 (putative translation factor)